MALREGKTGFGALESQSQVVVVAESTPGYSQPAAKNQVFNHMYGRKVKWFVNNSRYSYTKGIDGRGKVTGTGVALLQARVEVAALEWGGRRTQR
jgi:hypothetical protein